MRLYQPRPQVGVPALRAVAALGVAELDASDPAGVADRMMVTLSITGAGDEPPTEAQQQELFEFAQELYQELAQ